MKLGISTKTRTNIRGQGGRLDHWGNDLYVGDHKWQDWYAWRPAFAYDAATNRRELVWLETLHRRRIPAVAGTGLSGVDTGYWVLKQKAAT